MEVLPAWVGANRLLKLLNQAGGLFWFVHEIKLII